MSSIHIRGARTHNLRDVNLDLPRDRLIVITGLSGSGKSSLAFDTIYAEGQRRYVESLSTYARQFLAIMEKPDVDHIDGLSPAISIEQKSTSHNPRSTVGTVTEIHDYLRLLFARSGEPRCPEHDTPLKSKTVSQMVDEVLALPPETRIMILAPLVAGRKGEYSKLLEYFRGQGFLRARINGELQELDPTPVLAAGRKHSIDIVVDRLKIRANLEQRVAESFETALQIGGGMACVAFMEGRDTADLLFSSKFACPHCGYSLSELEPRLFSFNSPAGACRRCDGLGEVQRFDERLVVPHPELAIPAGAIRGWDTQNAYYFRQLEAVARHYGCDLDTPFAALPERIRAIILNGSGMEEMEFEVLDKGKRHAARRPFEGIIPNMERRYRETGSNLVREELAKFLSTSPCPECKGTRLRREARHVYLGAQTLPMITAMSIEKARQFFAQLRIEGYRGDIGERVAQEINKRLQFLIDVGLGYLTLSRRADTLSGGEAQRIRLASQVGAGLVGVMYVLDEPSIGLHQRDNQRLLNTLTSLRDTGNTVIVVEHDEGAIRAADHVVDMGPGAGTHGGHVVAQGAPEDIMRSSTSLTGQYLSGRRKIEVPRNRKTPTPDRWLRVRDAHGNNLKHIDVDIPVGLITCVTGVSGSGKSTLVNDTLARQAERSLNGSSAAAAPCAGIEGLDLFDKVISIDQSPIGRTPRSNPATYTGVLGPIRELFAATPEARARGYGPGRFSFNVRGGRCEECQGDGLIKVEMHFLPDIYVPCDICAGKRYNRETLNIKYKGKTIHDVLEMTVEEAGRYFGAIPVIARKLRTLEEVGLSYIKLGQNAVTLSGGEAQRVKLSRELAKRDTGNTLYILDEPTTGLHFHDVSQLLSVLQRLRDHGNSVVIIEHNMDVIKTADWIIDLGPEGGDAGGRVVATGAPEQIAGQTDSHTGRFLAPALGRRRASTTLGREHGAGY